MRTIPSLIAAALVVASSAIVFGQANAPAGAPAPVLPAEFGTQTGQRIRVTRVAGDLVHPWSIAFADEKTILVTEQPGPCPKCKMQLSPSKAPPSTKPVQHDAAKDHAGHRQHGHGGH